MSQRPGYEFRKTCWCAPPGYGWKGCGCPKSWVSIRQGHNYDTDEPCSEPHIPLPKRLRRITPPEGTLGPRESKVVKTCNCRAMERIQRFKDGKMIRTVLRSRYEG
jgi:hypothetical protein